MSGIKDFFKSKKNIILLALGVLIIMLTALYFSYGFFYYDEKEKLIDEHAIKTVNPDLLNIVGSEQLGFEKGEYFGSVSPTVVYEGLNPEYYDVYIELFTNNFIYTTDEKEPEIILKLISYTGEEITSLQGFDYKTVGDISGFDVTEFVGKFPILIDVPIAGDDEYSGRHTWTFSIYYVDLYSEQIINHNKNVVGDIIFEVGEETADLYDRIIADNGGTDNILDNKFPNNKLATTTYSNYYSMSDSYLQADYVIENALYYLENSYYYRGAVTNNWVYFADAYWQIVRINSDGSFRLIYSGVDAPSDVKGFNKTTDTSISIGQFSLTNNALSNNAYASSNIKTVLDSWYTTNLSAYDSYIINGSYCYETGYSTSTNAETGISTYTYNAYKRLIMPQYYRTIGKPSFNCAVSSTNSKIGLISADEVIYAGIVPGINNSFNYLSSTEGFYTGTSATFDGVSTVFAVDAEGQLVTKNVSENLGFRPVINLKSDLMVTGSGHYTEPYIIQ